MKHRCFFIKLCLLDGLLWAYVKKKKKRSTHWSKSIVSVNMSVYTQNRKRRRDWYACRGDDHNYTSDNGTDDRFQYRNDEHRERTLVSDIRPIVGGDRGRRLANVAVSSTGRRRRLRPGDWRLLPCCPEPVHLLRHEDHIWRGGRPRLVFLARYVTVFMYFFFFWKRWTY